MMISIGANRNRLAYGIKHYNVDTEDDLRNINTSNTAMGTTAFVIETSQQYMLNGSGEWKKIKTSNNNGGGSSSDDPVYDGGGVEGPSYDGGGVGDDTYEGGGV
jgi:uncharacterized membrane protein